MLQSAPVPIGQRPKEVTAIGSLDVLNLALRSVSTVDPSYLRVNALEDESTLTEVRVHPGHIYRPSWGRPDGYPGSWLRWSQQARVGLLQVCSSSIRSAEGNINLNPYLSVRSTIAR
jgi:hypothetical protein